MTLSKDASLKVYSTTWDIIIWKDFR